MISRPPSALLFFSSRYATVSSKQSQYSKQDFEAPDDQNCFVQLVRKCADGGGGRGRGQTLDMGPAALMTWSSRDYVFHHEGTYI